MKKIILLSSLAMTLSLPLLASANPVDTDQIGRSVADAVQHAKGAFRNGEAGDAKNQGQAVSRAAHAAKARSAAKNPTVDEYNDRVHKKWMDLSADKKQRIRERREAWGKITPEQQKQLRGMEAQLKNLSPEQKEKVRNFRQTRFEGLTPEQKDKIRKYRDRAKKADHANRKVQKHKRK